MFQGDEEPKEWEVGEEVPPEKLRKKWEAEDRETGSWVCASCKRETPRNSGTCIFCGEVLREGFSWGRLFSRLKRFLKRS
ncbi:MAG TPA: hypothetical protein PLL75_04535 [Candidatus Omnitrophota bacterium]|nr:hypothetical protein [Candidatus Omnitrophota bacterium]HPS36978.1 hypothetical protein [Candidatus Omnitrophota bacterium]